VGQEEGTRLTGARAGRAQEVTHGRLPWSIEQLVTCFGPAFRPIVIKIGIISMDAGGSDAYLPMPSILLGHSH